MMMFYDDDVLKFPFQILPLVPLLVERMEKVSSIFIMEETLMV